MYTLDTNVIIYYLDDELDIVRLLDDALDMGIPLFVAGVTETELFGYAALTSSQMKDIEDILQLCRTIHTNANITRIAGAIRRESNVKTIDAIIAATTFFTNSTLITRNIRDFKRIPSLKVEKV